MHTRSAIILAAGFGSRLQLRATHKLLTVVGGRTLLDHHVRNLERLDVHRVVVVTGHEAKVLTEKVCNYDWRSTNNIKSKFNPDFQKGNGLSVLAGVEGLEGDEPFWLTMSDHLFDPALYDRLADRFFDERPSHWEGALMVDTKLDSIFDMPDATKVRRDPDDFAIGKELERFDAVDAGLFWCGPGFVEALRKERKARGDCSTSDAVRRLYLDGRFGFWDIGELLWQDIDTIEALAHAEYLLAEKFRGSLQCMRG